MQGNQEAKDKISEIFFKFLHFRPLGRILQDRSLEEAKPLNRGLEGLGFGLAAAASRDKFKNLDKEANAADDEDRIADHP